MKFTLKGRRLYMYLPLLDDIDDICKVENFEQAADDDFKGWDLHHKYGTLHSVEWMKEHGVYYHRPYYEFIFLKHGEHTHIHHLSRNKH